MKVIAISGSPRPNGSVDRLVQSIAGNFKNSDPEFISLADTGVNPCRGCLGCVENNRCVQQDGWTSIEPRIRQAEIMVLGIPTYYGAAFGINALTHNFLERWFALRHGGIKLNLKKVILALVSGEDHAEIAARNLQTFFSMYHGIEDIETVTAAGITPCYVCGRGEYCPVSSFLQRYGAGARITGDMIVPPEEQQRVQEQVKKYCGR